jgi:hypothetical protein
MTQKTSPPVVKSILLGHAVVLVETNLKRVSIVADSLGRAMRIGKSLKASNNKVIVVDEGGCEYSCED